MFEVIIPRCIRCGKELKVGCTKLLCKECQIEVIHVAFWRDYGDFGGC
ncbi:MAG: hypothetical protein ACXQS8_06520 [Candidatus Helarchaeales archaeon]